MVSDIVLELRSTIPSLSVLMLIPCSYRIVTEMKSTVKQALPDLSPESWAMGDQTTAILRQEGYIMTIAEAAKNPRLLQLEEAGTVVSMSSSSKSAYKIPVLAKL